MTFPDLPVVLPGDIYTAATIEDEQDGIRDLAAVYVRKTITETVNNSAALQNDDVLVRALEASALYEWKLRIYVTTNATADFKCDFVVPAGCSMVYDLTESSQLFAGGPFTEATVSAIGLTATHAMTFEGLVIVGSTAGNLQFRWAQNTMTVVNTQVLAGSYMALRQLA